MQSKRAKLREQVSAGGTMVYPGGVGVPGQLVCCSGAQPKPGANSRTTHNPLFFIAERL